MSTTKSLLLISALVGTAAVGYFLGRTGESDTEEAHRPDGEAKIAYWVAPMDPKFRSDKPGKSPMGMDLVPVYQGEEPGAGVRIAPSTINNIGVRLGKVERGAMSREIRTVGFVGYDETLVSHVHMRAEGWIDELVTKVEGERVNKGDLLFRIYSPDLVVAQSEYLQALRIGDKEHIALADERLRLLGFEPGQVQALARSRNLNQLVEVFATQDGVITELNVAEKMFVTPGTSILTIADLSTVWVLADVFEDQAGQLAEGLMADVRRSFEQGGTLQGHVDYVYPMVDPDTRTVKVRFKFDNPEEALKPNMFADVTIFGAEVSDVLVIPKDALIRTGSSTRVVVALGDGRFEPREVREGTVASGKVQIVEGLHEGEDIVVSGQFLIDSEASLSASLQRMGRAVEAGSPDMQQDAAAIKAKGTVNAVMIAHSTINLTHEPIPEIGWPTMTMDFNVAPDVDLGGVAEGDTVHFELGKDLDGVFEITGLHVMTGKGEE